MGSYVREIDNGTVVEVPSGFSYGNNKFDGLYEVIDFDSYDDTYHLEPKEGQNDGDASWAYYRDIEVATKPGEFVKGEQVRYDDEDSTVIHQEGDWVWVRAEYGVSGRVAHKNSVERVTPFKVGSNYALKDYPDSKSDQFEVTGIDRDGYATGLNPYNSQRSLRAPGDSVKYKEI